MTDSRPTSADSAPALQVAIVAWQALPAVVPQRGQNVGGLETAAWLLARGLSRDPSIGCSLVVRAEQAVDDDHVDGVTLVVDVDPRESVRREVSKAFEAGLAGLFRRWRLSLLWQLPYLAVTWPGRRRDPEPRQADPRLLSLAPARWIAMGVSRESAGGIATAHHQGRPAVLMIQSNARLQVDLVFAAILWLTAMGLGLWTLVGIMEKRIMGWKYPTP